MKPIRLSIAGLNSFRERQEIDFTKLTELGMFGIFGPTGSGKSSILDAITLALYGHVVRADRSTQGILNQAEKKLEITFDFDIGAGSQRKHYRVERLYRRAGTGEYSVQNQASRLLQLERGIDDRDPGLVVVADSKRDVDRAILGIVGLEQSDFTRAVVLPQGKFAEFLQLTGGERNAMTERLFGLERLGQSLLRRVSDRGREAEHARGLIEAQQAELGDASEEAVNAHEVALEEARKQFFEAQSARHVARETFEELQRVSDLLRRIKEVKVEREALLSRAGGIDMLRDSLERHRQALTAWPHIVSFREAESLAQAARTQWELAEVEVKRAKVELDAVTVRCNEARARREAKEPGLRERLGELTEAQRIERDLMAVKTDSLRAASAWEQAVASASSAAQVRDRLEASSVACQQQLTEVEAVVTSHTVSPEQRRRLAALEKVFEAWRVRGEALHEAEVKLRERQTVLHTAAKASQMTQGEERQLDNEFERLQQERNLLERNTPACTREVLSTLQTWRTRVESRLVTFREAVQAERLAQANAESAQKARAESHQRALEERNIALDLEAKLDAAREAQQQFLAASETALIARLQARLGDGAPCPVCGSMHYALAEAAVPVASDETLTKMDFDDQLRRVESAWREAEARAQAVERTAAQAEATAQLRAVEADNKESQRIALQDELRQLWLPELQQLGQAAPPQSFDAWERAWPDLCVLLEKAMSDREKWDERSVNLTTAESNLAERRSAASHALELAQAAERAAEAEASAQHAHVTELSDMVSELREELWRALLDCQPNVRQEAVGPAVVAETVREVLQQAERMDRLFAQSQARLTQLRSELTDLQRQLAAAERQVAQTEREVSVAQTRVEHFETEVTTLASALKTYTDGDPVSVVRDRIERTLDNLLAEAKLAEEGMQAANETYQTAQRAEASARTEYKAREEARAKQERRLTDALAAAGFVNVRAVEDARLTDAEAADRAAQVNEYEATVARTAAVVADLEKQLDGRSGDEEALGQATVALQTAEEHYNQCAKAEGAAQENLAQIIAKRSRWEELERERVTADALCTRIGAIARVLRGNAFVRYVAREQMERVARQASVRLSNLTHGRYTLLIDDDGGFLMRDDHNGGSTRPVSTLSGGETFLTSLSLALALSAHIQLRGQHPLEFFFLDEGFGTLDPELLDVVVTSLERLNLDHLSVGLISHVPELRQRLQRRLIVEPALPAGRGTTVRLELA